MAKKAKSKKTKSLQSIMNKYSQVSLASEMYGEVENMPWLPSRSLVMNWVTGGGIPFGKVLELFGQESSGKSLVALDFLAICQKLGGWGMWVDAESSYSKDWWTINGIDLDKVLVFHENAIEVISDWTIETARALRKKLTHNEPILYVLDSIAALDTIERLEMEQTDEKAEMGIRAKAMGNFLRKRSKELADLGVTCIFINQLRKKLGTMFEDPECSHYNTLVRLRDGRVLPIGEIVENEIQGEVLTYNEQRGEVEFEPITGWTKKPRGDSKWYSIITDGIGSLNGSFGEIVSENHYFYTDKGWLTTTELSIEDSILSVYQDRLIGDVRQFLIGTMVADCTTHVRSKNTACIGFRDRNNPEYVKWKIGMLSPILGEFRESITQFKSLYTTDLAKLNETVKRNPLNVIMEMDFKSLAVWFMDDGHNSMDRRLSIGISQNRCDLESLSEALFHKFGLVSSVKSNGKGIIFNSGSSKKLSRLIREYIPDCMQYKLLPEDRGYYKPWVLQPEKPRLEKCWSKIKSIREAGERNYKNPTKSNWLYDITVNGNHNYFGGSSTTWGILNHNTTPGGEAMKFFAHIRMGFYRKKQIKEKVHGKETWVGNYVSLRMKKNKVAPPRPTMETEVYFLADYCQPGFSRYAGLAEVLESSGAVKREKGSSIYYDKEGNKIARGEDAFQSLLEENKDIRSKLIKLAGINTFSNTKKVLEDLNEKEINLFPVGEEEE